MARKIKEMPKKATKKRATKKSEPDILDIFFFEKEPIQTGDLYLVCETDNNPEISRDIEDLDKLTVVVSASSMEEAAHKGAAEWAKNLGHFDSNLVDALLDNSAGSDEASQNFIVVPLKNHEIFTVSTTRPSISISKTKGK